MLYGGGDRYFISTVCTIHGQHCQPSDSDLSWSANVGRTCALNYRFTTLINSANIVDAAAARLVIITEEMENRKSFQNEVGLNSAVIQDTD